MMDTPKPFNAQDLEYLDLEQAAVICSVSNERFQKWIEKGVIPVIDLNGKKLVHTHDLIQHLVRHNIPIPDRLLQGNSKKILFVLADENVPHTLTTEIIWALYRLRKKASYIFDFVRYDNNIELKIITFGPDLIILLQQETSAEEPQQALRRMVNGAIPIHAFSAGRAIDVEALVTP